MKLANKQINLGPFTLVHSNYIHELQQDNVKALSVNAYLTSAQESKSYRLMEAQELIKRLRITSTEAANKRAAEINQLERQVIAAAKAEESQRTKATTYKRAFFAYVIFNLMFIAYYHIGLLV